MINRDEKGRFAPNKVEEEVYDVIYKSKLLNKEFDSLAELKKAEEEFKLAEKKKEDIKEAKKAEAKVVETAIDDYENQKILTDTLIREAYNEYKSKVAQAEKALAEVENKADKELNAFLEKHPEGFHYTYKSKDGKITREYTYYNNRYNAFDDFECYLNAIDKLFKNLNN